MRQSDRLCYFGSSLLAILALAGNAAPAVQSAPVPLASATSSTLLSEEISCRTFDMSIDVLNNSRGVLVFQGRPDRMPDTPIVEVGGRIERGGNYIDRIFAVPGFQHVVRTTTQSGPALTYYITIRGGQELDRQLCS